MKKGDVEFSTIVWLIVAIVVLLIIIVMMMFLKDTMYDKWEGIKGAFGI